MAHTHVSARFPYGAIACDCESAQTHNEGSQGSTPLAGLTYIAINPGKTPKYTIRDLCMGIMVKGLSIGDSIDCNGAESGTG